LTEGPAIRRRLQNTFLRERMESRAPPFEVFQHYQAQAGRETLMLLIGMVDVPRRGKVALAQRTTESGLFSAL